LFVLTAGLATLVLVITTDSFAKKKQDAESPGIATTTVIDINSADEKTLESLPGIGKSTAKAIVAGRPYKNIDDLKRVKGMSDKKISAIKDKVTFGAAAAPAVPASIPTAAGTAAEALAAEKPTSESAEKTKSKLAPGQPVNINTASREELEACQGSARSRLRLLSTTGLIKRARTY
jgi:competence protein ComEA